MKTKSNPLINALLALAGLALLSSEARAGQTLTSGDVFVGFRSTTSPNNAVLFNVGNVSQFTNSVNFSNFSFGSVGTTGADLVNQFGSGWYTDSTVTWGIFSSLSGSYALASKAESVNGTQSTPYAALNSAKTGTLISAIGTVQNNYITSTAATNTANAAYQTGTAAGTYYSAVNLNPNFTSGAWPSGSKIEGSLSQNLDLYYFTPASVQVLGGGGGNSLTINSNGVISYFAAAISSSTNVWSTNSGNLSAIGITNSQNLVFAGSGGLVTNNQVSSLSGITFSNTASASYTLSGSNIAIGASGIVNNSSSTQTVATDLTLSAAQTFNAASGNLVVSGAITNGGNTLTIAGANNTTLSGAISGVGGLTMAGAGTTTLSAVSTFSGNTLVSSGTLLIAGYGNTNSAVNVGNSSVLNGINAGGPATLGAVTVTNGGSLALSNAVTDGTLFVKSLSLASNSISSFDLKSTNNYSSLNSSGNIVLGGALTLAIQGLYNNTNSQGLFQVYSSGGAISGNFSSVNITGSYTGTLSYYSNNNTWQLWGGSGANTYYAGINLNSGLVTVIPEPSSYALFALGGLIAIISLRRNKSQA